MRHSSGKSMSGCCYLVFCPPRASVWVQTKVLFIWSPLCFPGTAWTVFPQRRPRGRAWRAWALTAARQDPAPCWPWTSRTSRPCGMKRSTRTGSGGKHRLVKVPYTRSDGSGTSPEREKLAYSVAALLPSAMLLAASAGRDFHWPVFVGDFMSHMSDCAF